MKTDLRHPAAGIGRLCRGPRSTGLPDDSSDGPTGRRAFLAIPLLLAAMRESAPADLCPVERAGWILDASDR